MYIGLDLGTSGLKGIVIDDAQTICAEATAPLQVSRPQAGWSEQAPQDWLEAATAVLSSLAEQADLSACACHWSFGSDAWGDAAR
jgi:xylulokinase